MCGATTVFSDATEDDRKEVARLRDHTHLRLSRATLAAAWYDGAMVTLLTIEPLSNRHGTLIVEAFNMFFIDGGGQQDGNGDGFGNGYFYGDGFGNGYGYALSGKCPEEWRVQ